MILLYITSAKQHVLKTIDTRLNYYSKKHMIRLEIIIWGSVIPELENRVTHYDVTNRVTNPKILFF